MSKEIDKELDKELDVAEQEAAESDSGDYKLTFKKPFRFSYDGKDYDELQFDFDALTGKDAVDIENEMQKLGKMLITPAFSTDFIMRMISKACRQPIGVDGFERLPLYYFNKVRSAGRSFLLKSE